MAVVGKVLRQDYEVPGAKRGQGDCLGELLAAAVEGGLPAKDEIADEPRVYEDAQGAG